MKSDLVQENEDMIAEFRPVSVKRLPEVVTAKTMRSFLREVDACVDSKRPRIVLDCSRVREIDGSVIQILLHCLEEAMKRNGDVKLAQVPPTGAALLDLTGVSRLFDVFDTTAEAINSFYQLPTTELVPALVAQEPRRASERAA